jgi:Fur family iron response transcriptional regulator
MIPTRKILERVLAAGSAQPARMNTDMAGCPWHDLKAMLRKLGLRPTRQRIALGRILFGKGDRHFTAESLYAEARGAEMSVSLATIYNTLHSSLRPV